MREAVANLLDNALEIHAARRRRADRGHGREPVSPASTSATTDVACPPRSATTFSGVSLRARNGADLPGVGLGLSIVETIARLHGMDLTVADNAPGARFTLTEAIAPTSRKGLISTIRLKYPFSRDGAHRPADKKLI